MSSKSLWAGVLTLALSPAVMAAGSPSTSRPPPAAPAAHANDYEQGVKAVQARDFQRALPLFQKVAQADPRNADAWNYIGFSQRKLKHFDESLAAYQKALALNPNHKGALEYMGELYLDLGDMGKAREQLAKLHGLCPTGCSEYDDLNKAVTASQATQSKN
ncbi:tetratricopeptide repeat protein [Polaromonas jejuensis]|uniref:Tetratricopeptide repeat protein n=1 Tax=Polaromonas jejuensis TaxID=457502 RepID=A0ABW0QJ36_9BURK|nr:tetratricopeptide repeat protein [Polaromonas jejuensis]